MLYERKIFTQIIPLGCFYIQPHIGGIGVRWMGVTYRVRGNSVTRESHSVLLYNRDRHNYHSGWLWGRFKKTALRLQIRVNLFVLQTSKFQHEFLFTCTLNLYLHETSAFIMKLNSTQFTTISPLQHWNIWLFTRNSHSWANTNLEWEVLKLK